MGSVTRATRLVAIAAAALATAAPPARAGGWPNALPAQPLIQAERRCAPGVVALNRRCHVVDFVKLGPGGDGRDLYYAFYATHWADRHGRMDRGFPVIFFLQKPATLRLGLWINDEPGLAGRWATTPPPRPVLLLRTDGDYLGFSLKAIRGADDQRLFRRDKIHWKEIDILHRQDADQAKIDAVTPRGCETSDDSSFDWPHFKLIQPLRESLSRASCGYVTADLAIKENKISLVSPSYFKGEPKDLPPQTAGLPPPAPLTPGPAGHTSPLR